MGIKFIVKPYVPPAPEGCQQHNSIAEAIADPFPVEMSVFTDTADNRVDAGKFGAVKYNVNGGYGEGTVPIFVYNIFTPAATCVIYIVDQFGTTIDSYNNSGGGDVENYYIGLPAGTPFYVVIENTGSGSCDIYEHRFADPS